MSSLTENNSEHKDVMEEIKSHNSFNRLLNLDAAALICSNINRDCFVVKSRALYHVRQMLVIVSKVLSDEPAINYHTSFLTPIKTISIVFAKDFFFFLAFSTVGQLLTCTILRISCFLQCNCNFFNAHGLRNNKIKENR